MPQRKTDHYSITATGSNVTVHVTDSLITSDAAEKGPLFKLTGEGDVTFDSEAGCVKDVNMKYKLEVNRRPGARRVSTFSDGKVAR